MMKQKITICPLCNGANIVVAAYAEWDTDTDDWMLIQTFPNDARCNSCGEEVDIDKCWKDL